MWSAIAHPLLDMQRLRALLQVSAEAVGVTTQQKKHNNAVNRKRPNVKPLPPRTPDTTRRGEAEEREEEDEEEEEEEGEEEGDEDVEKSFLLPKKSSCLTAGRRSKFCMRPEKIVDTPADIVVDDDDDDDDDEDDNGDGDDIDVDLAKEHRRFSNEENKFVERFPTPSSSSSSSASSIDGIFEMASFPTGDSQISGVGDVLGGDAEGVIVGAFEKEEAEEAEKVEARMEPKSTLRLRPFVCEAEEQVGRRDDSSS